MSSVHGFDCVSSYCWQGIRACKCARWYSKSAEMSLGTGNKASLSVEGFEYERIRQVS